MKKRMAAILLGVIMCCVLAGGVPGLAAELVDTGEEGVAIVDGKLSDANAMAAIESYFEKKVTGNNIEENVVVASAEDLNVALYQTVSDRIDMFYELEERLGIKFQDVTIISDVRGIISQDNNTIVVDVSEYTVVNYEAVPGSGCLDVMAYETPHCITLELVSGRYEVIADSYDERLITGACSADILDSPVIVEEDVEIDIDWLANSDVVPLGEYPAYDVQEVIEYAHKYCGVPYSLQSYTNDAGYDTDTMNPAQYNSLYRWYENADCANFVSQCLVAGGLQRDITWQEYTSAWKVAEDLHDYLDTSITVLK